MKALIAVLLALALAVGLGIMTHNEPGYVFVGYGNWSVETTLAVMLIGLVVLFLSFYLVLRFVSWTTAVPTRIRDSSRRRKSARARRLFNRALVDLAAGRWIRAERLLAHPDVAAENTLLAALMAALAAQQQHADERRDQYLSDAVAAEPGAETAVSLMQAELQFSRRQYEQALANLTQLRQAAPRQQRVPRMLAKVLRELGDWQGLSALMPEIRQRGLFDEDTLAAFELKAWRGLLDASAAIDVETLRRNWAGLPKIARENPQLLLDYSRSLRRLGHAGDAETVVREALERRWNDELVEEYGLVAGSDPGRQLDQALRWQRSHEQNPAMLVALGRLSIRRQLWGKARAFFEQAIAIKDLPQAQLELARLLERMGEKEAACAHYRKSMADTVELLEQPMSALRRDSVNGETDAADKSANAAAKLPATTPITH